MSCGLRRLMRLPLRSSMSTLTKCAHWSTGPVSSGLASRAVAADHLAASGRREVDPDLVRIDRALREVVAQVERADDDFDQVRLARLQLAAVPAAAGPVARHRACRRSSGRTGRCGLSCRCRPAQCRCRKSACMSIVFWKPSACSWYARIVLQQRRKARCSRPGRGGCGPCASPLPSKSFAPKSPLGLQRHVADRAVLLGLRRVVEAPRAVAGDAAEQVRVVVVLAAQELLVVVQLDRQADLVAGRAELGGLVERLEERLLVEVRLGLDQLVVDPLQRAGCRCRRTDSAPAPRWCSRRCRWCC